MTEALACEKLYVLQNRTSTKLPPTVKISQREKLWPFQKAPRSSDSKVVLEASDLSGFDAEGHTERIKLQRTLVERIDWICQKANSSRADAVLGLLFHRMYGQVAYEQLHDLESMRKRTPASPPRADSLEGAWIGRGIGQSEDIKQSKSRNMVVEEFGYADIVVELRVPARMWTELDQLARAEKLDRPNFIRFLLISSLLGYEEAVRFRIGAFRGP